MLKMNLLAKFDLTELTKIKLFREVPNADLLAISERLYRKTFSAGSTLMNADQSGEAVYFIRSGAVKVHIEQADGCEVIISILGPGESVGEMSALDQQHRSASVTTLEESELLWMDCATFKRFLAITPKLSHNLACLLSARLRQANEQIQLLAAGDIESRVARQLIGFAEKYGQAESNGNISIPVRLTQKDLAGLIGATRESVNKIVVSYKERGILSATRNHYWTIHNRHFLASRCG